MLWTTRHAITMIVLSEFVHANYETPLTIQGYYRDERARMFVLYVSYLLIKYLTNNMWKFNCTVLYSMNSFFSLLPELCDASFEFATKSSGVDRAQDIFLPSSDKGSHIGKCKMFRGGKKPFCLISLLKELREEKWLVLLKGIIFCYFLNRITFLSAA